MLVQTLSGGALGRRRQQRRRPRDWGRANVRCAEALAWHAIAIAVGGALVFGLLFALLGPALLARLGGTGEVLTQATPRTSASCSPPARASGSTRSSAPSSVVRATCASRARAAWWRAPPGAPLGRPDPRLVGKQALGITGAALSVTAVASVASLASLVRLARGAGALRLRLAALRFEAATFREILRVGLGSAPAPILTVFTIVAVNGLVSGFGPAALAGYGIGSRLEFLLDPAGVRHRRRADRDGWAPTSAPGSFERAAAHRLDRRSASAAALTGTIGRRPRGLSPPCGSARSPSDPLIHQAGTAYLRTVGPCKRVPTPRALALLRLSGRTRDVPGPCSRRRCASRSPWADR